MQSLRDAKEKPSIYMVNEKIMKNLPLKYVQKALSGLYSRTSICAMVTMSADVCSEGRRILRRAFSSWLAWIRREGWALEMISRLSVMHYTKVYDNKVCKKSSRAFEWQEKFEYFSWFAQKKGIEYKKTALLFLKIN